jgi:hypothetical protein
MLKAMMDGEYVTFKISDSKDYIRGFIQGMTKEDGSGHNWIVTVYGDNGKNSKLFVRGDEHNFGGRVIVLE